ncbi:hypothetical protein L0F63_006577 [Massospora cicadina]|nr:hypothetical protein L0F63_006577 [Massospora cicadina]
MKVGIGLYDEASCIILWLGKQVYPESGVRRRRFQGGRLRGVKGRTAFRRGEKISRLGYPFKPLFGKLAHGEPGDLGPAAQV